VPKNEKYILTAMGIDPWLPACYACMHLSTVPKIIFVHYTAIQMLYTGIF